jgi:ribonuclease HIII
MTQEPSYFVATIDTALKQKLETDLIGQGFVLAPAPYAFFSAKKQGISCVFYHSGKLTVQGKAKREFIEFYLEPEILKSFAYTNPTANIDSTSRIGLDEAGKGDFFGPLCIAGFFAPEGSIEELLNLGVKDSKALNDVTILQIAKKLKEKFPHKILRLFPETYNRLYGKFHNLNRMLAWAHTTVLEELSTKTGCKKAILDQFAIPELVDSFIKQKKLDVDLTQRVRGEEDPVVAAASILARAAFVEGMEELEKEHGLSLPKGASSLVVQAGKKAVAIKGPEILEKVAKLHFKTREVVLHD